MSRGFESRVRGWSTTLFQPFVKTPLSLSFLRYFGKPAHDNCRALFYRQCNGRLVDSDDDEEELALRDYVDAVIDDLSRFHTLEKYIAYVGGLAQSARFRRLLELAEREPDDHRPSAVSSSLEPLPMNLHLDVGRAGLFHANCSTDDDDDDNNNNDINHSDNDDDEQHRQPVYKLLLGCLLAHVWLIHLELFVAEYLRIEAELNDAVDYWSSYLRDSWFGAAARGRGGYAAEQRGRARRLASWLRYVWCVFQHGPVYWCRYVIDRSMPSPMEDAQRKLSALREARTSLLNQLAFAYLIVHQAATEPDILGLLNHHLPPLHSTTDNQSIDNQSANNQSIDNQSANNQSIDNQSANNQSIDNQSIDNPDNQSTLYQRLLSGMMLASVEAQKLRVVARQCSKPPFLQRHWLGIAAVTVGSYAAYRFAVKRVPRAQQAVDELKLYVRSFWREHVMNRALALLGTITGQATFQSSVSPESVASSEQSLQRMVVDFYVDKHPQAADSTVEEIRRRSAQGDISIVMTEYEKILREGSFSLLSFSFVRLLLIQVQKQVLEFERALFSMDQLLSANELLFSMLAAVPTVLIGYLVPRYLVKHTWRILTRPASKSEVRDNLLECERLLLEPDTSLQHLGHIATLVHRMYCLRHLFSNQEQRSYIQALIELQRLACRPGHAIEKTAAVSRIFRRYNF